MAGEPKDKGGKPSKKAPGRPPGFGKHDLTPYVEAVRRVLPGAFEWRETEAHSLMGWVVDRFVTAVPISDRYVPHTADHVSKMLAGNVVLNPTHLDHLNHVLGLDGFGLEPEGTWYEDEDGKVRLLTVPEFETKLVQVQDAPRDPVRVIRNLVDNGLLYVDIEPYIPENQRLRTQFSESFDKKQRAEPAKGGRTVEPSSFVSVRFRTRVSGHVLLLSRRLPDPERGVKERLVVLNDASEFGLPRSAVYDADELVFSQPVRVTKHESDEIVICINWPIGLDVDQFDPDLFLDGKSTRQRSEVMTVSAAMRRTLGAIDAMRVHAAIQTLHIRRKSTHEPA